MLDLYGYRFVALLRQMCIVEAGLRNMLANDPGALAPALDSAANLPALAVNVASSLADELNLESTKHQINTLRRVSYLRLSLDHFLDEINQLEVRIEEDLRGRKFLFMDPALSGYWDQPDFFGLGAKFKDAQADIKEAGNCLALSQGTACLFHLMRAMEVAVRRLSKRLNVTITPHTTWRQMTGLMDDQIRKKPENTAVLKRKKNDWEAARANLHHVGSVWRNNTMHPATTYTPSQARDVFQAVRVFMTALAAL
jgi:hypothetical protein